MKKLINSTTILSLALYVVPPAAQAQENFKIMVEGTEVICLPDKEAICPEGNFCVVAKKEAKCEEKALEALAELAAEGGAVGDAVTTEEEVTGEAAAPLSDEDAVARAAEEEVAAQAAAEEEARKAAEAEAAAIEAARIAEQEAAAQAAAEEEARKAAEAEAAANEAARIADEQAAEATAAAAEAAAAADDQAVTEEGAADPAQDSAEEAVPKADEPTATDLSVTVMGETYLCLPDASQTCPEEAQCVVAASEAECLPAVLEALAAKEGEPEATEGAPTEEATEGAPSDAATVDEPVVTDVPAEDAAAVAAAQAAAEAAAAAALADPNVEVIDAPVPTEEAVDTLESALQEPVDPQDVIEALDIEAVPAVEGAEVGEDGTVTLIEEIAVAKGAEVTEEVVTEEQARSSSEEFAAAPTTVEPGKKTGLSDFEKVGLIALGALVVGSMLKGNRQVVSNTGDRVVVRQPDGSYQVYKDDNALLREPGSTVRTETFRDGSTRTIVTRQDGSQIVTIRDATGRVLQRVAYDKSGRGVVLIDDTVGEDRIDVTQLPRVRPDTNAISIEKENAALRAALAAAEMEELHHRFSLRQIRNIAEVRWLAPTVDVNNITFESGSAAIQASEARKLNKLGRFMLEMIEQNPRSLFLVEGHTDAVGSAASNLTLSDRRAESVAKALTEFFDVPPENLVVQGYGESELKIETQESERLNRRVAVRIITDLLKRTSR